MIANPTPPQDPDTYCFSVYALEIHLVTVMLILVFLFVLLKLAMFVYGLAYDLGFKDGCIETRAQSGGKDD